MDNQSGKRVRGKEHGGRGLIALMVTGIAVGLLVVAYLILCAVAGAGNKIMPKTAAGGIPLGGLTARAAEIKLNEALSARFGEKEVSFTCDEAQFTVPGTLITTDSAALSATAKTAGQSGSFLGAGAAFLGALFHPTELPLPLAFSKTPPAIADALSHVDNPVVETSWAVSHKTLVFTKGVSGKTIDTAALEAQLLERFSEEDYTSFDVPITTAQPADPDLNAVQQEVSVLPADAYLDPATKRIVPAVIGVSFDVSRASTSLAATAEGDKCNVPLTEAAPAITTAQLNERLFRDVLGHSSTKCPGPSNRWHNITLAAGLINGTVLLPGEVFSYTKYCGPYSSSTGYKKAGAYQAGKTVDTTAGGICQLSSTLYWTTLKANLETVERSQHKYDVGYLPSGMDATVYGDTLDFKFKNSTDYPIKIEAYQDKNHNLNVTLYGTNISGVYGDPEREILSTISAQTVYEASAAVPAGSAPQKDRERTAYNGKKVAVYQVLRDKSGKQLSRKLIHTDTYSSRNAVYLYNPADAARLGIDPATGTMSNPPAAPSTAPSVPPTTHPSTAPSAKPTTSQTPSPTTTPTPVVPTSPVSPTPPVTPTSPVPPVSPTVPVVPVPPADEEALPTPEPEGI